MTDLIERLRGIVAAQRNTAGEYRFEIDRLRRELTEVAIECAFIAERLAERDLELAEARGLLQQSALALDYCQMMLDQYVASGQYTDDRPLIARIDAFLAGEKPRATYQGDPRFSCVYCCDTGCQYCAGEKA